MEYWENMSEASMVDCEGASMSQEAMVPASDNAKRGI